ncbi:hypothetical protein [Gaopeijia maritima]|uniref:Uncharacterized protein n=1 Tax=Gaopeijia maritima TaxID=3119007 RepID=A0ABU9E7U4_9BACT
MSPSRRQLRLHHELLLALHDREGTLAFGRLHSVDRGRGDHRRSQRRVVLEADLYPRRLAATTSSSRSGVFTA